MVLLRLRVDRMIEMKIIGTSSYTEIMLAVNPGKKY
jgi:hypothetical protein